MTRAYSDVNLVPTAGSGVLLQNVPQINYEDPNTLSPTHLQYQNYNVISVFM